MTNELIPINYEGEQPTVSARELYDGLEIKTAFKDWFPRMAEYGFETGKDFNVLKNERVQFEGNREVKEITDYSITVDMAKQICMLQRSEKGRQYRQYFIDLEKAWNTPEQIFARALKMADREIEKLKASNGRLSEDVTRMKPKRDLRGCSFRESHLYPGRRACEAAETEWHRDRTETPLRVAEK